MTEGDALAAVLADSQTMLPVIVVFWVGREKKTPSIRGPIIIYIDQLFCLEVLSYVRANVAFSIYRVYRLLLPPVTAGLTAYLHARDSNST